jgi:hypothetical protein
LENFSIAKVFQTFQNALLRNMGRCPIPHRGYPPLDPDPLLKSGGNIIAAVQLLKRYYGG